MFEYYKYKRIALALKNCNFVYDHHEWIYPDYEVFCGDYGYDKITQELKKFLDSVTLMNSYSSNFELLPGYLSLFNIKLSSPSRYHNGLHTTYNISSELESYLGQFDILIGITSTFFSEKEHAPTIPLRFYQLLIYFLQPFGRIGLVPIRSDIYDPLDLVVIDVPHFYIFEQWDHTPESIVIPGEFVLKLISYHDADKIYQDSSLFTEFWYLSDQNTFFEFFVNEYVKDHQLINN